MGSPLPLIPAEAGTQSFGCAHGGGDFNHHQAKGGARGSHWVPASAGMSGA